MTGTTTATAASLTGGAMVEISGLGGGGPSGWYTYMTSATGSRWFSSDTGSSNGGGFRQLVDGAGTTGRAFGSQGSGSAAGYYGIVLKNTSGSTITSINISFDAVMNRNPSTTANPTTVSYRISSTDVVTSASTADGTFADAAGTWNTFSTDLSFTSPSSGTGAPGTQAAITPLFKIATKTVSSQSVNWPNNSFLYIRLSETDDSGSDSTQGVDNFSISLPAATAPAAPTITSITPGNGQLSVAFTAGSNGGSAITNYKYSTDGGTTFTAVSPAATTSPIIITGLTNGTSYNVQIKAVNAIGDGTATGSTSATPRTIPSAPTITGITSGNGSLSVAFTAGANGGSAITNYKYSTDGGSTFTAVSPAATTSPISITGLSNGTAYNVQIRAVNAAGDGTATGSTSASRTPRRARRQSQA